MFFMIPGLILCTYAMVFVVFGEVWGVHLTPCVYIYRSSVYIHHIVIFFCLIQLPSVLQCFHCFYRFYHVFVLFGSCMFTVFTDSYCTHPSTGVVVPQRCGPGWGQHPFRSNAALGSGVEIGGSLAWYYPWSLGSMNLSPEVVASECHFLLMGLGGMPLSHVFGPLHNSSHAALGRLVHQSASLDQSACVYVTRGWSRNVSELFTSSCLACRPVVSSSPECSGDIQYVIICRASFTLPCLISCLLWLSSPMPLCVSWLSFFADL